MEEGNEWISEMMDLLQIKGLRLQNTISEEAYQREKWKRLNSVGIKREEMKIEMEIITNKRES